MLSVFAHSNGAIGGCHRGAVHSYTSLRYVHAHDAGPRVRSSDGHEQSQAGGEAVCEENRSVVIILLFSSGQKNPHGCEMHEIIQEICYFNFFSLQLK